MKTTLVKRYNCDHCNKRGFAAGSMRKHEERCTLNPLRKCAMCNLGDGRKEGAVDPPLTIQQMVAMLPAPKNFIATDGDYYTHELQAAVQAALPALREATKNCPACILAAIRQAKIPVPCSGFDFKAECSEQWSYIRVIDNYEL